jgi:hypothetical protein
VLPTTATGTSTQPAQTSGVPPEIPQVIAPPGGLPPAPSNSTLIQLGFNKELKYPFVAATGNSSSQILYYTPLGLVYALGVPASQVIAQSIRPYDTTATLGYITTVVLAYIPTDQVNVLAHDLTTRSTKLFQQKDPSIRTLFSMINPAIPLFPGQGMGGSPSPGYPGGSGSSGASGSGSGTNPGGDAGGSSSSSSGVRTSSVGIGLGVVAGAAAYGAGMFYIARRYRKRRQLHNRSSSTASEQMSEASGANASLFRSMSPYGGANSRNSGRSNRTQMISAPVMAENSLGWN